MHFAQRSISKMLIKQRDIFHSNYISFVYHYIAVSFGLVNNFRFFVVVVMFFYCIVYGLSTIDVNDVLKYLGSVKIPVILHDVCMRSTH